MALPLKIKLSLREHWDAPTSPAKRALHKLHEVLGLNVQCDPEWVIITSELRSSYDERGADLVVSVAGLIRGLCEAVIELADDETWADELWTRLGDNGPKSLSIFPEVSSGSVDVPIARWDSPRRGIILSIPQTPITAPLECISSLKDNLLKAFEPQPSSNQWVQVDAAPDASATVEPLRLQSLSIKEPRTTAQQPIQYLPDAASLPRPDELLSRPPYYMIVRAVGELRIDVECTHSPTLDAIANYLKRWCRTNHSLSTKPPVVDIRLQPGSFGAGLVHDVLTLEASNQQFHVSPTLILHLVESVFGYERTHTDTYSWQFQRDAPFKVA
ncbi:hypothetical protein LIA77_06250 [Sarocladium implicatum]|nr:hypothetical protein LIA77_06250 [Sarocladium implicatum]